MAHSGPQQAGLHSISHAYQLCQPANGRSGWTAGDWKKRGHSDQQNSFIPKGVSVNNTSRKDTSR